jgi:hypothetical protein
MPALSNPRHEAFAQALFAGLAGETRVKRAQSTAYLTAYPNCSNGNSAEAAASRLLRRVKLILDRVLELQAEQTKRTQRKIDISRDRLARRLDLASTMAEQQQNVAGIVASEMGIAKVFGIDQGDKSATHSFKDAQSMQDIGERLLRSVGLSNPSAEAINAAIEANDAFVARTSRRYETNIRHDVDTKRYAMPMILFDYFACSVQSDKKRSQRRICGPPRGDTR